MIDADILSMPMYFPDNFSMGHARAAAKLSLYAYNQYADWVTQCYPDINQFSWKPSLQGFTFYDVFYWSYETAMADYRCSLYGVMTLQEPIGFLAIDVSGIVYVVFRGTASSMDEIYDADLSQTPYGLAPNYGLVHSGFYSIYTQLSPLVRNAVNNHAGMPNFVVTGHSLGAGLASLAVPDIITNTAVKPGMGGFLISQINFGSPRVGDPQFTTRMNSNKVPSYRVVNTEDVVPCAPLAINPGGISYKHLGTPVDFTAQYLSDDGNHSMQYAYKHAIDHPGHPQGPPPPKPFFKPGATLDVSSALAEIAAAKTSAGTTPPAP